MPLLYLPPNELLFLWGVDSALRELPELGRAGSPHTAVVVTPDGRREVKGLALPLLDTLAQLTLVPAASIERLPASVATWVLASKLALELVARERIIPTITRHAGRIEARWAAALGANEEAAKVAALARSMPPSAHALPATEGAAGDSLAVWAPAALLRAYLDAVVDALVRTTQGSPALAPAKRAAAKSATWD